VRFCATFFRHLGESTRPAIAHRATVRFGSDAAKTAKTKGFISPSETNYFVWLVISHLNPYVQRIMISRERLFSMG
jgi:hypothetical protein